MMLNTLLVDENVSYRQTLSDMLLLHFPLIGVDEAGNGREALTWTPPVCQVSIGKKDRLQSYIRPVDGVYPPGLYGIRRRGPI